MLPCPLIWNCRGRVTAGGNTETLVKPPLHASVWSGCHWCRQVGCNLVITLCCFKGEEMAALLQHGSVRLRVVSLQMCWTPTYLIQAITQVSSSVTSALVTKNRGNQPNVPASTSATTLFSGFPRSCCWALMTRNTAAQINAYIIFFREHRAAVIVHVIPDTSSKCFHFFQMMSDKVRIGSCTFLLFSLKWLKWTSSWFHDGDSPPGTQVVEWSSQILLDKRKNVLKETMDLCLSVLLRGWQNIHSHV